MNKSIIGWMLILTGIGAALVGTWFFQNAISGVMTQIHLDNLVLGTYLLNMQLTAIMTMSGILLTIIGVALAFNKKE